MTHFANQRGSMLIQTVISAAIMGVMITAFSTMMQSQQSQTQGLAQKLEILQLQTTIMGSLADSALCGCNLDPTKNTTNSTPLYFNSNNLSNEAINLSALFSTCIANAPANPLLREGQALPGTQAGLNVSNISLANLQATGTPGSYIGTLTVNFDSSSMVIARKPASVPINFQADRTIPGQARITNCSSSGSGSGGGGSSISTATCVMRSFSSSSSGSCQTGEAATLCFIEDTQVRGDGGSEEPRTRILAGTISGNSCTLGRRDEDGLVVHLSCCK